MSELDFLRNVLGIQQEELLRDALAVCRTGTLQKGDCLFRPGQAPTKVSLLMKGILRGFFLDAEGNVITDCLVVTPGYPLMPESNLKAVSELTVEALTDTQVFSLPMEAFYRLKQRHPEVEEMYQKMLLLAWDYHRQLKVMMYQYTAAQRYQWFVKNYPHVKEQIGHKHIASFLNMSPVTLSRLINTPPEQEEQELLELFHFPRVDEYEA